MFGLFSEKGFVDILCGEYGCGAVSELFSLEVDGEVFFLVWCRWSGSRRGVVGNGCGERGCCSTRSMGCL